MRAHCGVCLLCGVLSLAALPGEPQTLFPCQAAASGRDGLILIWFSKSCISDSYVPSWGCGLGTEQFEQGSQQAGDGRN